MKKLRADFEQVCQEIPDWKGTLQTLLLLRLLSFYFLFPLINQK